MWRPSVSIVLLMSVLLAGCSRQALAPKPERGALDPRLALRLHWAGAAVANPQAESAVAKTAFTTPEAIALRQGVVQKLAETPRAWLQLSPSIAPSVLQSRLRPLIEDWAGSEWVLEGFGATNQPLEWTLALRLDPNRVGDWNTNLALTLRDSGNGAFTPIQRAGHSGWEWKRANPAATLRLVQAGSWIIVGLGSTALPHTDALTKQILDTGRLTSTNAGMFNLEIDVARFHELFGLSRGPVYPRVQLTTSVRGPNLRTVGRMVFDRPIVPELKSWTMPTNTIREPLVGLLAARGIAPWTSAWPFLSVLTSGAPTDQAFVWGLDLASFQTFIAIPTANSANALATAAVTMPNWVNSWLGQRELGRIVWSTNKTEVWWADVPFAAPHLRTTHEPAGEFLVAGLYPMPTRAPTAPQELLNQFLSRTDLLLYDWEVSQPRLTHWRAISGLVNILAGRNDQLATNTMPQRWLSATAPLLRNAATEIVRVNAQELEFTRTSQLGLTAFELTRVTAWLDRWLASDKPQTASGPGAKRR